MKCDVIIDAHGDEKIVIYARQTTPLIEDIRQLAEADGLELIGYRGRELLRLNPSDICCVCIIDNKLCAVCETETWQLKARLYQLESRLPAYFVKINQSCIANLNKVERFDAAISGTLKIRFPNGYTDYVSRRQVKLIKERLGISR